MNSFLNLTPTVKVAIENPFFGLIYPRHGALTAVVDTGYEGFLVVPRKVFEDVALDKLRTQERSLRLADGSPLACIGAYGSLHITDPRVRIDGFIETYPNLEEVLVGVEGLARVRLMLDYCLMRIKVDRCA